MELFILCIKIFFVRILDVSLGTVRTIITVKGQALLASLVGFVELFVWFIIVKEALNTDSTSIFVAISYAGGFAAGTYIGSKLSSRFIKSTFSVQIITSKQELITFIRNEGYAVTVMNIKGRDEKIDKYMLFIEIQSRSYSDLRSIVEKYDKGAFMIVDETKYVHNGLIK